MFTIFFTIIYFLYVLNFFYSLDEGFFIILTFVYYVYILFFILADFFILKFFSKKFSFIKKLLTRKNLLYLILLYLIINFSFYGYVFFSQDLTNNQLDLSGNVIFECNNNKNFSIAFDKNLQKQKIVDFLKKNLNKTNENKKNKFSYYTSLYFLTEDKKWIDLFKEELLNEINNTDLVGYHGSVKSKQIDAATIAHNYLELRNHNPTFFDEELNDKFIDWIYTINKNTFNPTYADYIYAVPFKQSPEGPYQNQEIGVASLVVYTEVIKDRHPALAERNMDFINKNAVGWSGNFKNIDDSLTYQYTWIYHSWLLDHYSNFSSSSFMIEKSFDYILYQWPSGVMTLNYNHYYPENFFDTMYLGFNVLRKPEYLWLANKMINDSEYYQLNNIQFALAGTKFFNEFEDNYILSTPSIGSCIIKSTTGTPQLPGKIMPDKLVLREGWDEDSLYLLENLRFSGWHRYKATNSIIRIDYKYPFVVEKYDFYSYDFLPKGKADYRDKKFDRVNLNGLLIEKNGIEKLVWYMTRFLNFESKYRQDPPKFAEVVDFKFNEDLDYAISKIKWSNIEQERNVSLYKGNKEIIVTDKILNPDKSKYSIVWHLKGSYDIKDNRVVILTQYEKSLAFSVSCQKKCEINFVKSKQNSPVSPLHKADLDVFISSDEDNVITSKFIPF